MTNNETLKNRLEETLENVSGKIVKHKEQVIRTLAIIATTCHELTKKYNYTHEDYSLAYSVLIEKGKVKTKRLSKNIDFLKKLSENNEFGA